jgi:hypothetical protein
MTNLIIVNTTTVQAGTVDLNAVGEYNGKPIFDVDPDSLEDRPWRKPGKINSFTLMM